MKTCAWLLWIVTSPFSRQMADDPRSMVPPRWTMCAHIPATAPERAYVGMERDGWTLGERGGWYYSKGKKRKYYEPPARQTEEQRALSAQLKQRS